MHQRPKTEISPSLRLEEIAALREQSYNATISYLHLVNEDLMIVRVQPDFPIPAYKAGQYTALGMGYWEPRCEGCQPEDLKPEQFTKVVKRAYSISNPILGPGGDFLRPQEEDFLEFYIVLVRQSDKPPALTPRLFRLQEGDRLYVSEKITGRYTLDLVKPDHTVIFMATGTGEAPHNKMLLELVRNRHQGLIASVVCVRYERDLGYLETQSRVTELLSNYRYITLTTREPWNQGKKVYVQDLVRSGELEEQLGQSLDPASTHVYLCGNPQMIGLPKKNKAGTYTYPHPTGVIEILESRGFKVDRPGDPGNIHFEEYW